MWAGMPAATVQGSRTGTVTVRTPASRSSAGVPSKGTAHSTRAAPPSTTIRSHGAVPAPPESGSPSGSIQLPPRAVAT